MSTVIRDQNVANSLGKEIKQNTLQKKITLKGNITTTYIEHNTKILKLVYSVF